MRIIYTYGVFDILHVGHIILLEKARKLGDYLIVGIVGDKVIHATKGKDRPINNEQDRSRVISSLSCVDAVVYQYESDPITSLKWLDENLIKIDVVVHGDDFFPLKDIETAKYLGIEIINLPYSKEYSTTKIIEKIRK